MKSPLPTILLIFLLTNQALAQLTVSSPCSRAVYQRDSTNRAVVFVSGLAPTIATRIIARFVPVVTGQGVATTWQSLSISTATSVFQGAPIVMGGWYRLDVRALAGADTIVSASIDRVGVGEVFIVAGQSNAYGMAGTAGATDDRVSVLDFKDDNLNEQLLPVSFSHADAGVNVGPSNPLHIWATLGNRLVKKLGVPVLFLGAAHPATNSQEWQQSAAGLRPAETLFPYRKLGAVLLHYAARTGIRAVLWHQGEGDTGRGEQQYVDNVGFVIQKSREQLGLGPIPWVVSRVSYIYGAPTPAIIRAQNRLITEVPGVFAGPQTDDLVGAEMRPDATHFGGTGLVFLEELWYQSLNDQFFGRSKPITAPATSPAITTGYVLPNVRLAGEQIWVPFVQRGPFDKQTRFRAQLLRSDDVSVVAESAPTTQNPISFSLPTTLATGDYRVRVVSDTGGLLSRASDVIRINQAQNTSQASPIVPILPNQYGGMPDTLIQKIGYRYDRPTHGFGLLIAATGPIEARLERVDGGYFGETNWAKASESLTTGSYNYLRTYNPTNTGIGGVESGRYRLSVRRIGNSANGQWVDVSLLDERNTIYSASDSASTVTYANPLRPNQPAKPDPVDPLLRQSATGSESIDWQLWPNPTAGTVTINLPANVGASLNALHATMTTATGITWPLTSQATNDGKLRLTLGDAPTGLYFVQVSDHDHTLQTWRVLKK
jgi:hypothetical protein